MFIVEIGSIFTTILAIANPTVFAWLITIWLWRPRVRQLRRRRWPKDAGKAQADRLRRGKTTPWPDADRLAARRRQPEERRYRRPSCQQARTWSSRRADHPRNGDVVEGIASVDESAITGSRRRSSGIGW